MSQVDENDLLNEALRPPPPNGDRMQYRGETASASPSQAPSGIEGPIEYRQWQIGPNDTFRPAGVTRKLLPVGTYRFECDNRGLLAQRMSIVTDNLVPLPDSTNVRVLEGMRKFWSEEQRYKEYGLLYKRGILLWGPPGGGKTATLQLLSQELMEMGGIVVFCNVPQLAALGLEALRRIEPKRRLICIIEDIDELINRYGEHDLLALLDGENQVSNVVMIGTTNYPDRLGARIVNRPSRFDERIFVGPPSVAARTAYLERVAPNLNGELARWVEDTKDLSIAHLRELAAAVLCLDQPYDDVIKRLRSMKILPREGSAVGFS